MTDPRPVPRCQVVPLPDYQVSFLVAGEERLRWYFGPAYPRPFFYPLVGPSRSPLTRMGHPGAPDHDHHRSIWFAHHKVQGVDFWSDRGPARVRQKQWLCYQDGDAECAMAVRLGWFDGHDPKELLEQDLIVSVWPKDGPPGETFVELQSTFRPTAATLELGQTNFGFLAVRVAKSISAYFGGGTILNSAGQAGEPAIFGQPAKWVDYSGPVSAEAKEGITYFDHPTNPGHPARWHVREDGWMGASVCFAGPVVTRREKPLTLRYLLHAHSGDGRESGDRIFEYFAKLPALEVVKANVKHTQFVIRRR